MSYLSITARWKDRSLVSFHVLLSLQLLTELGYLSLNKTLLHPDLPLCES